jgi:hypothetical protein
MAQILERPRKPTEVVQRRAAPVQNPSCQDAVSQMNSTIKGSKPVGRPACKDESGPKGSQHVCFTVLRTSPAGQAQCGTKLANPRLHITDIAKDDPGGLVCNRRCIRMGPRR